MDVEIGGSCHTSDLERVTYHPHDAGCTLFPTASASQPTADCQMAVRGLDLEQSKLNGHLGVPLRSRLAHHPTVRRGLFTGRSLGASWPGVAQHLPRDSGPCSRRHGPHWRQRFDGARQITHHCTGVFLKKKRRRWQATRCWRWGCMVLRPAGRFCQSCAHTDTAMNLAKGIEGSKVRRQVSGA